MRFAYGSPKSEKFPVLSLHIREPPPETSSPPTPPTAIESAIAETLLNYPSSIREIPAIPRGFGWFALSNPNRRRRVRDSEGAAAHVYLCCQVRRCGLARRNQIARSNHFRSTIESPDIGDFRLTASGGSENRAGFWGEGLWESEPETAVFGRDRCLGRPSGFSRSFDEDRHSSMLPPFGSRFEPEGDQ